jgi:GNAT superfamily N-acetyltransferase
MTLLFTEISADDVDELTRVMTSAFDDDTHKHLGVERGGPEGYDDGSFFRNWLFERQETVGYKILYDGRIIGGFILWIYDDGHNVLGTMFTDPEFQDRGVGTRAWQFIEKTYPDTRGWTLETPSWAKKNHRFYQDKCGFRKTKENVRTDHEGTSFVYQKVMVKDSR